MRGIPKSIHLVEMARLLSALLVCAVLSVTVKGYIPASHGHSKEYINSWAVEVYGGRIHADEVARRNGFENHGEVMLHITDACMQLATFLVCAD